MVAIRPNPPDTSEVAIDRLRETDAESLHPAADGMCPVGLDQEVNVVRLHRKVNDAKVAARACGEAALYRRTESVCSERRETSDTTHRDVDGMAVVVDGAWTMRHARAGPGGLASGSGAATTMGAEGQIALSGHGHLKGHI